MDQNGKLLVVTPTLGDSPFLAESVRAVSGLASEINLIHRLVCPEPVIPRLSAAYPHCIVVADAGRAGGIYGAINCGIFHEREKGDWQWFTYINDDDLLMPDFARVFREHTRRESSRVIAYGDVRNIGEQGESIGL